MVTVVKKYLGFNSDWSDVIIMLFSLIHGQCFFAACFLAFLLSFLVFLLSDYHSLITFFIYDSFLASRPSFKCLLYFILYSKFFWQDPLFKITFHSLLTILKNTSSFTYKSLARSIVLKCSIISIQPGTGLRSFINFGSKSLKIVRSSNLLTLLSGT